MSRHPAAPALEVRGAGDRTAASHGGGDAAPRPTLRASLRSIPRRRVVWILLALLALLMAISAAAGAVHLSLGQVLAAALRPLGLALPWPLSEQQHAVFWAIRAPRVVLAALVGATLAVAGGALQGVFRNPLADPALIGVSSGASVAAATVIVAGAPAAATTFGLETLALPAAAFAGALISARIVLELSRLARHGRSAAMLLIGIAVNALAWAGTGLLSVVATESQLRGIAFWNLGSLGGATWLAVAIATPLLLGSAWGLTRLAAPLNLLLLGEAEAGHLGVDVARLQRRTLTLAALGVGAAVAFTGVIAFLGLVVPHLVRLLLGPDHRRLLLPSAALGSVVLVGADLIARTAAQPAELPIGVVTAVLGAPFFLWLLVRARGNLG